MSAVTRASQRDLRRRGWGAALMVFGVALGVAVVVAIDLANVSAARAFELSTERVVGRATHRIEAGPSGIATDLYADLRRQHPEIPMAPVIDDYVSLPESGDRPLRVLGVDPFAEAPFRDLLPPLSREAALGQLLSEPGAMIASADLAEELGLRLGQDVMVQAGGLLRQLTLIGIAAESDDRSGLPSELVLVDIASAQELFERPRSIDRIDLQASEAQVSMISQLLSDGATVRPASAQAETAADLSRAFSLNLFALSMLALVVGMFLIYNTMMFSVVQRRAVLATLRALGATRRQVFLAIQWEAALIGLTGGVLGVTLGWLMAQGAVRLVSQTISDFYFLVDVRQARLEWGSVIKGIGLALGASVLAASGPGAEAAAIDPADALRRSGLEAKVRRWLPAVSLGGVLLCAAGVGLLLMIRDSLAANFAGMFGVLIGLALLSPAFTVGMMRLVEPPLRWIAGTSGKIASRTVRRALSRTSVAIAALMVALSVTIGVGIMIFSFRDTVENWLDLSLRADLYVSAPSSSGTRPTADLQPALAGTLAEVEGVAGVETFRVVRIDSEFGEVQLAVADASRERSSELYRFASGSPDEVWEKVQAGAVVVSEPFATRHNLPLSESEITLRTDDGLIPFQVVGVYYDFASDRGTVLMADSTYRQRWSDRAISSVALYLEPGAALDQVQASVRMAMSGTGLIVQPNRAIRAQALDVFDRTFAITAALRLLAVIVAFVGVLSALLALQLERRREMATLRALGLSAGGLSRLTALESGLMGLTAGLLSLPTGLALAIILIYVINLRSFGWTIQPVMPLSLFGQALLVGVGAAVLASLAPGRRLQRTPIGDALRAE